MLESLRSASCEMPEPLRMQHCEGSFVHGVKRTVTAIGRNLRLSEVTFLLTEGSSGTASCPTLFVNDTMIVCELHISTLQGSTEIHITEPHSLKSASKIGILSTESLYTPTLLTLHTSPEICDFTETNGLKSLFCTTNGMITIKGRNFVNERISKENVTVFIDEEEVEEKVSGVICTVSSVGEAAVECDLQIAGFKGVVLVYLRYFDGTKWSTSDSFLRLHISPHATFSTLAGGGGCLREGTSERNSYHSCSGGAPLQIRGTGFATTKKGGTNHITFKPTRSNADVVTPLCTPGPTVMDEFGVLECVLLLPSGSHGDWEVLIDVGDGGGPRSFSSAVYITTLPTFPATTGLSGGGCVSTENIFLDALHNCRGGVLRIAGTHLSPRVDDTTVGFLLDGSDDAVETPECVVQKGSYTEIQCNLRIPEGSPSGPWRVIVTTNGVRATSPPVLRIETEYAPVVFRIEGSACRADGNGSTVCGEGEMQVFGANFKSTTTLELIPLEVGGMGVPVCSEVVVVSTVQLRCALRAASEVMTMRVVVATEGLVSAPQAAPLVVFIPSPVLLAVSGAGCIANGDSTYSQCAGGVVTIQTSHLQTAELSSVRFVGSSVGQAPSCTVIDVVPQFGMHNTQLLTCLLHVPTEAAGGDGWVVQVTSRGVSSAQHIVLHLIAPVPVLLGLRGGGCTEGGFASEVASCTGGTLLEISCNNVHPDPEENHVAFTAVSRDDAGFTPLCKVTSVQNSTLFCDVLLHVGISGTFRVSVATPAGVSIQEGVLYTPSPQIRIEGLSGGGCTVSQHRPTLGSNCIGRNTYDDRAEAGWLFLYTKGVYPINEAVQRTSVYLTKVGGEDSVLKSAHCKNVVVVNASIIRCELHFERDEVLSGTTVGVHWEVRILSNGVASENFVEISPYSTENSNFEVEGFAGAFCESTVAAVNINDSTITTPFARDVHFCESGLLTIYGKNFDMFRAKSHEIIFTPSTDTITPTPRCTPVDSFLWTTHFQCKLEIPRGASLYNPWSVSVISKGGAATPQNTGSMSFFEATPEAYIPYVPSEGSRRVLNLALRYDIESFSEAAWRTKAVQFMQKSFQFRSADTTVTPITIERLVVFNVHPGSVSLSLLFADTPDGSGVSSNELTDVFLKSANDSQDYTNLRSVLYLTGGVTESLQTSPKPTSNETTPFIKQYWYILLLGAVALLGATFIAAFCLYKRRGSEQHDVDCGATDINSVEYDEEYLSEGEGEEGGAGGEAGGKGNAPNPLREVSPANPIHGAFPPPSPEGRAREVVTHGECRTPQRRGGGGGGGGEGSVLRQRRQQQRAGGGDGAVLSPPPAERGADWSSHSDSYYGCMSFLGVFSDKIIVKF